MGVSGSGKTAVGLLLAEALNIPFQDGDDLHPPANVSKMASGIPLNDDDRWPWLDLCAEALNRTGGAVIACSALRRSYRDRIRKLAPQAVFVHLDGSEELIHERMAGRQGHFMKQNMLRSQLDTLEALDADEAGFAVDISREPAEIAALVLSALPNVNKPKPE